MEGKKLVPELRFPGFEGEWKEKKLGEIATFINGKAYKQVELLEKGRYPVLRVGNFFSNSSWYFSDLELPKDKFCDYGDLLYAWSASFGPKIWDGNKTIYHYHIWKVLNAEHIDKKYLFYLLDEQTLKMKTNSSNGFALLHITKGTIENWDVKIPVKQKEQKKIATFLTALDQRIQLLQKKKLLLESYKNGLMQQLFNQELRFRDENGNDFADWEEKKLGEVGKIINGLTYSPSDIDLEGVLVLRSSNVKNRKLVFEDNVFVKTNNFNPVKENDILICVRNGSNRLIGKNAIINKQNEGKAFGAFMSIYRSKFNLFIFHWFDTTEYKKEVHKNLGATINSINGSDLVKFKIPFPSLIEQQKIASFLSSIDEAIERVALQVEKMQGFKKGLLQRMFV
ncbi:restriction endonuclease subunit S [Pedobacter cryophilus]|uniref:restriction endonuclease subunit S n=1 Tax=Pedobacter cryophilus TaxID=2571271 RepID=UPI00145C3C53|nr:restriction endonuclease subunit S [Pedobacter cryophilus]